MSAPILSDREEFHYKRAILRGYTHDQALDFALSMTELDRQYEENDDDSAST